VVVDLKLAAARVARGDQESYRTIVEHTKDGLFRLCCRMLGNAIDAEDALQDAYVKGYRSIADGRFSGESRVDTWLYRIAANTCLDALRRRKVRRVAAESEPAEEIMAPLSPEASLALSEIEEWLGELPPDQRAAVVLRCVEGLTSAEAAKVLGCSAGAIEQRLVRARATLRGRRDDDQ
jgi:RNA polymerase sigma-70 factor (ECF subfamily)